MKVAIGAVAVASWKWYEGAAERTPTTRSANGGVR
jgi:hypothetical protein